MLEKLLIYLSEEEKLLAKLLLLAEKQQSALVGFKVNNLESITKEQDNLLKSLKNLEDQRIRMFMTWFGIGQKEAASVRLTTIEKNLEGKEKEHLTAIRLRMDNLSAKLKGTNLTNRMLANKAKRNVGEMISFFTNGTNQVCNVRV